MGFLWFLVAFTATMVVISLVNYFFIDGNKIRWYLTLSHLWAVALVILLGLMKVSILINSGGS